VKFPAASSICPGGNSVRGARTAFHALLSSVSTLAPSLPPASAAGLQAIRCWALHYSPYDRAFLHRCVLFHSQVIGSHIIYNLKNMVLECFWPECVQNIAVFFRLLKVIWRTGILTYSLLKILFAFSSLVRCINTKKFADT
jgi:hypothetical protein